MRHIFNACLAGLLLVSTLCAEPRFHLAIEKTVLPNALTLLTCVDSMAESVTYTTFINAGSRDETRAGASGIARIIEMMAYQGTDRIPDYFNAVIPTGAVTESETTEDFIRFSLTVRPVFLRRIMEIEADRMMNFKLTRDLFKQFIPVAELSRTQAIDDSPAGFLRQELFRHAYRRHTYRHPIYGWESDLGRHLIIQDVFRFDRIFITPNYTTIVICGNFDPVKAAEWILEEYGDWKPSLPPTSQTRSEPEQRKTVRRDFDWPNSTATKRMMIGYHGPDLNFDTPELVSLQVAARLLFGECGAISERLYEMNIIESSSASMPGKKDPYLFTIDIELKDHADFDTVFGRFESEVNSLSERSISQEQIDRVTNSLKLEYMKRLDDQSARTEIIGLYQLAGGDYRMADDYIKMLESLTVEDIQNALETYFIDHAATVVTLNPRHMDEDSR